MAVSQPPDPWVTVTCDLCLCTAALFPSMRQTLSREGLRSPGASKEGDETRQERGGSLPEVRYQAQLRR